MNKNYLIQLCNSLSDVLLTMTGYECEWQFIEPCLPAISSGENFVSVLGLIGPVKGRIIMELAMNQAHRVAEDMNGENLKPYSKIIFESLAELTNIFSGRAITVINNQPERLGLRLTPPNILVGEDLQIFSENNTLDSAVIKWNSGCIYVHLSIERSNNQ